jgi:hypothetical protein
VVTKHGDSFVRVFKVHVIFSFFIHIMVYSRDSDSKYCPVGQGIIYSHRLQYMLRYIFINPDAIQLGPRDRSFRLSTYLTGKPNKASKFADFSALKLENKV